MAGVMFPALYNGRELAKPPNWPGHSRLLKDNESPATGTVTLGALNLTHKVAGTIELQ